jgi:OOP family OmpA-OmpF porin
MNKLIFTLIAAVAAMGAAQAQTSRVYVGAGFAFVDHSNDRSGTTLNTSEGWDTSGQLFGGWEWDRNWAVEGGYTDYNTSSYAYNIGNQPVFATTNGFSIYLAGKYTFPINEHWGIYGKLGVSGNTVRLYNDPLGKGDSKSGVYASIGGNWNLNKNTSFYLQYERYGTEVDVGAKADVVSIGAKYTF